MIYKHGSITIEQGRLDYTVYVNDIPVWSLYSRAPAPRIFVVIDKLQVPEVYRNRGIGKQLIQRMVNLACELGSKHLCLWADIGTYPGVDEWYLNQGFFRSAKEIDNSMQPLIAIIAGDPKLLTNGEKRNYVIEVPYQG